MHEEGERPMSSIAAALLLLLARATVVLGLSALLALGLVRLLKPASAMLQQVVWLLVVLQGVLWVRWEITW
jgi:hypothetical protein